MNSPDELPSAPPIDPTTFAFRLMHRPINRVEGFEHGAHARVYLRQCADRASLRIDQPRHDELHEAGMRAAGYTSFEKFTRHMKCWHDLVRPVPRGYADFLGVTPGELLAAVDEDRQDHRHALVAAPVLCTWTLRRIAGVYEVRPFPADCQDEATCIRHVRDASARTGLRAHIHIRGVKTLWAEPPDGHLLVTLYRRTSGTAAPGSLSATTEGTRVRCAWHKPAAFPFFNHTSTMPNTYSPTSATYRRVVRDAAHAAIREWLSNLRPLGMYLFTVDSVECALEFFEGHWGMVGDGRWRWGRVDAGDPDDELSGENVLLEVALGRPLPPQPPASPRRRQSLPALAGEADLTRAEIRAKTAARARENLHRITLQRLPRA